MIKKIIPIILTSVIVLLLSGCALQLEPSTEEAMSKDLRTLENFKQAYIDMGCTVKEASKPMFKTIGAVDAAMFYVTGDDIKIGEFSVARFDDVVKIYQYESPDAVAQAKEKSKTVKIEDWPENGKFVMETSNDELIKIFEQIP